MRLLICFSLLSGLLFAPLVSGATISQGDVTSSLEGTIFFDDARTGGSDITKHDDQTPLTVQRYLDFDGDNLINDPPGVPGTLTIQGFGFAAGNNGTAPNDTNDAVELDLTFIYLGQDQNPNSADDVVIGTERVSYNYVGPGEYFVNLDSDPSVSIDGLGSRIRIQIQVVDTDNGFRESLRIKQRPSDQQSFNGVHNGAVLSVSGSFAPVPEPSSMIVLLAFLGTASLAKRRI